MARSLTLIFDKSEIVPYSTTGGLETIAIRISHPVAYELIRLSGFVAAPSANTGRPSQQNAHVIDDLKEKLIISLIVER